MATAQLDPSSNFSMCWYLSIIESGRQEIVHMGREDVYGVIHRPDKYQYLGCVSPYNRLQVQEEQMEA